MTYSDICKSVYQLKKKYGEVDPFRLCEAAGILLLFQSLGMHSTAIKGFFMKCKRIQTITVNSDLPYVIQRIIVAHELGHSMLHQDSSIHAFHDITLFDHASAMEQDANLFAAELLLDDEAILDALHQNHTFFSASAQLMVPVEIMDYKLRLLKWKGYKLMDIPIQSRNNFILKMELPNNADCYN